MSVRIHAQSSQKAPVPSNWRGDIWGELCVDVDPLRFCPLGRYVQNERALIAIRLDKVFPPFKLDEVLGSQGNREQDVDSETNLCLNKTKRPPGCKVFFNASLELLRQEDEFRAEMVRFQLTQYALVLLR